MDFQSLMGDSYSHSLQSLTAEADDTTYSIIRLCLQPFVRRDIKCVCIYLILNYVKQISLVFGVYNVTGIWYQLQRLARILNI